MDQFISVNGKDNHALLLDCRDLSFKLAPIPANVALVIANTMVKHSIAGGDYKTRRAESEAACAVIASHRPGVPFLRDAMLDDLDKWGHEMAPKSLLRARHVISENLRTVAAADALAKGDLAELGRLMAEAHRSYSQDFEGSCVEADLMVELANDLPGLIGARLTGGGFGGCTINLVEQSEAESFLQCPGQPLRRQDRHSTPDSHLPRLRRRSPAGVDVQHGRTLPALQQRSLLESKQPLTRSRSGQRDCYGPFSIRGFLFLRPSHFFRRCSARRHQ